MKKFLGFATIITAVMILGGQSMAFSEGSSHFRVLPIGWVDGDMSDVLINQGPAIETDDTKILFAPANQSEGYRQIHMDSVNLKLGVYGGWYPYSGSYAATWFGAGVSVMPIVGSTVTSNRYVESRAEAARLPKVKIPSRAEALENWRPHDSLIYYTRGGMIYSVGVGYAFTGILGDYFAVGDWVTYIEKLDDTRVYVKVTNIKLTSLDTFMGNFIAYHMLSNFKKSDKMFSYVFNLANKRARVAYEAMVHGSIMEAQNLHADDPTLADLVLTEQGGTAGHQRKSYLGFPFFCVSKDTGNLFNYSDTVLSDENTENDVEYGLFWNNRQKNILGHHKNIFKTFYGTSYVTTPITVETGKGGKAPKAKPSDEGSYGTLNISYENDRSNRSTIPLMLAEIAGQTGLRDRLQIAQASSLDVSGYVHLSLTVTLSKEATAALMAQSGQVEFDRAQMGKFITKSFSMAGGSAGLCKSQADSQNIDSCMEQYKSQTRHALDIMRDQLENMRAAEKTGNRRAFVTAYAKFGEAMLRNEFTFGAVARLTRANPLGVIFTAEGERISKVQKAFNYAL